MPDTKLDPATGLFVPVDDNPVPSTDTTPATDTNDSPNDNPKELDKSIAPVVNLNDVFKPPVVAPVDTAISQSGMGVKDTDIKETLTNALESLAISARLELKKESIISIFKNHGMDSMSQKKAWDELMSVLVLEP